jgi:hypothetical protein
MVRNQGIARQDATQSPLFNDLTPYHHMNCALRPFLEINALGIVSNISEQRKNTGSALLIHHSCVLGCLRLEIPEQGCLVVPDPKQQHAGATALLVKFLSDGNNCPNAFEFYP